MGQEERTKEPTQTSLIWRSFVPYHVARDLTDQPLADPVGREQRFHAVVLFADISGFTAISEALATMGVDGAEELTTILNSYFEPMIGLIHSYGGIIGKFGGDAMTVLFPFAPTDRRQVARRAVRCAIDMQGQMARYAAIQTRAGTFSLTMKAGLAAGPVFCTTVGDPALRLEYIIAGRALDRCAEAEHQATQGQVWLHNDLLPALDEVEVQETGGDFSQVGALAGQARPAPLAPLPELPPAAINTIAAYMHPSIAERLMQQQMSFLNEHRRVTVLFACFENFDYDHDPQVGDELQRYLSQVIQIIHRYDGYLNKVDMGDKGSKYVALFGAPIAHEDDVERALRCALDLAAIPDIPSRIGINTGFVYCGQVGATVRHEYTVMGDAVNLAARLMQAAEPGEILVSEATQAGDSGSFVWESRPPIQVKGKANPIDVHALIRLRQRRRLRFQEPKYALPMVGRQAELQAIRDRLDCVVQGQGQIVGITAEAGMGKSRLAAEAITWILQQGLVGYGGECISHGTNTSYLVWQNLLRGFFGLDPTWPLETQLGQLEAELAAVEDSLIQRMPLLGRALNIPIPENDLTQALDAKLRKASLEALLVECIRHRARESPVLLVLEDCHWIDPLSNDLLETVGRNIADVPVLMLVVYRPPETERIQPRITRFGHFCEVRLTEFTPEEAGQLIQLKLVQLFGTLGSVPADFVERVIVRAQGNPFYIDEMISLIHDRNLDPSDPKALRSLELPDSLHSLIISRIDQLAEGVKTTLKVASVIGRLFRASWLWGVYPKLGTPEQVKEQLSQLSRLDITPLDKPEPELEYLFKHIVTREVAYESLAVATRTMLHEQIGRYIERTFPERLDLYVDLLAYHYGLSQNQSKQREYYARAGAAAQAAYANEAAIEYYQRLLPLERGTERAKAMLELGRVWELIGRWAEAETIYQQALTVAEESHDVATQARCEQAIGTLWRLKGDYANALTWLEQAQGHFEAVGERGGVGEALREIGTAYWSQGNYPRALSCYQAGLEIARDMGDRRGTYRAIGNMGLVLWTQGKCAQALACYQECHQIASDIGDRLGVTMATSNSGNVYLDLGDYPQALTSYATSLQNALEIGIRQGVGISVGNMGDVYEKQGHYASALACYTLSLQIALEIGDRLGVSFSCWNMAKTYLAQDDTAMAERLLKQAIALGRLLDTPYELCETLSTYADLLVQRQACAAAQPINQEALDLATQVDHQEMRFRAQVRQVRLTAAQGKLRIAEAVAALACLLDEWPADGKQAAVRYEIWRLDPLQSAHRQQAAELYAALYSRTPNVEYWQRYLDLSGEQLPDPPPLPPLPAVVSRQPANLETLLAQVDALLTSDPLRDPIP